MNNKFKHILMGGASFLASSLLFACSQENEPLNSPLSGNGGDYTLNISIPDGIRTRAAAQGEVGADGLYSFNRSIDRLWYAVYYDNRYLYDSESESAPQPSKTADGKFSLTLNLDKSTDPSKTYVFFWAGNADDKVSLNDVTSVSDGINLNFKKRCVSVDPKYMNGNNEALEQFDSFSGYVQVSSSTDLNTNSMSVTLHRPFAQIHILSDEFINPGVSYAFPSGVTVVPGYGSAKATTGNYSDNLLSPTTWFFDDEIGGNYKQNEFIYSQTNYEFTNNLSGSSTERVTFKNRSMDYLGCYYVFAPVVKADMKAAQTDGGDTYGKLNFGLFAKESNLGAAEFASVDLPSGGLKANNKYVIYNKPVDSSADPDDPQEGGETGSGFLSTSFIFDVIIDDIWGDSEEVHEPEPPGLEELAWGVPLKETEDPNWGRVGNLALWDAYKSQIGRYLVTSDGRAAKLDPTDSSKFADNGQEIDESKGNVMVIAPNLYYLVKESEEDGYPTLWMSTNPISDKKIGGVELIIS